MARRKKSRSQPSPAKPEKAANPGQAREVDPKVALLGIFTRAAVFRELEAPDGVQPAPTAHVEVQFNLQVTAGVRTPKDQRPLGEVTVRADIRPNPKYQPYEIKIIKAAVFQAQEEMPEQTFLKFCQVGGPTILWPYIRALANQLTADARFGAVRLDPANIAAMIEEEGPWQPATPAEGKGPASGK